MKPRGLTVDAGADRGGGVGNVPDRFFVFLGVVLLVILLGMVLLGLGFGHRLHGVVLRMRVFVIVVIPVRVA